MIRNKEQSQTLTTCFALTNKHFNHLHVDYLSKALEKNKKKTSILLAQTNSGNQLQKHRYHVGQLSAFLIKVAPRNNCVTGGRISKENILIIAHSHHQSFS